MSDTLAVDVLLCYRGRYRDQVRHHTVPTLRLDSDLTLTDALNAPLERARQWLRSIQRAVSAMDLSAAAAFKTRVTAAAERPCRMWLVAG